MSRPTGICFAMDPSRRAYIQRPRSPVKDITAPRRDPHTRISKPKHDQGKIRGSTSIEDEQTRKWVSEEDSFVLKQAKKKASIRVKEGRAKPIDWLAVILRVIDPDRDLLDDDEEDVQMDVVDPEGVFEGLGDSQLSELETDITSYITLETNRNNQDYWKTMKVICKDRRQKLKPRGPEGRAVGSVSTDVDRLLGPKSFEQLEALEKQIRSKLRSDEDIDVDYWEHLLKSLLVWKAKAKLKRVYQSVLNNRLEDLRKQQEDKARSIQTKLHTLLLGFPTQTGETVAAHGGIDAGGASYSQAQLSYHSKFDPESLLNLNNEGRGLDVTDESAFLQMITAERVKILKLGYVPARQPGASKPSSSMSASKPASGTTIGLQPPGTQRFSAATNEDFSQATKALYEREVARGVNENEEIFTAEELVPATVQPQWADKHRPRKPRYFNRVQMGYEWNKYNQTHYDHDNPPPKVVQGYKFNIFYPDLIDKIKAPTFKIIREGGRKRGEAFAPAGEEDTCLIRFIAGPPYEDLAFRIVDKDWDYSAKQDRGFRSSFDKVCPSPY